MPGQNKLRAVGQGSGRILIVTSAFEVSIMKVVELKKSKFCSSSV